MEPEEHPAHGHAHQGSEHPHEPMEERPRPVIAPWPLLSRGLALAVLAIALLASAAKLVRSHPLLLALPGLLLASGGFLAAWAAAIHITGGEKFDDHPFI